MPNAEVAGDENKKFADGVFVGEHGSWNRSPPVGYKVVFVPFRDGRPAGDPVHFVSGFRGEGEGGALGPARMPPEDGKRLVRDDRAKAQSFVTASTVSRVSRPPGSGH